MRLCSQRTWAARCCVRVGMSVLHSWTLLAQQPAIAGCCAQSATRPLRLPQCTSLPKQQTSSACLSTLVSQTPQALPFQDCMAARQIFLWLRRGCWKVGGTVLHSASHNRTCTYNRNGSGVSFGCGQVSTSPTVHAVVSIAGCPGGGAGGDAVVGRCRATVAA